MRLPTSVANRKGYNEDEMGMVAAIQSSGRLFSVYITGLRYFGVFIVGVVAAIGCNTNPNPTHGHRKGSPALQAPFPGLGDGRMGCRPPRASLPRTWLRRQG